MSSNSVIDRIDTKKINVSDVFGTEAGEQKIDLDNEGIQSPKGGQQRPYRAPGPQPIASS